MAISIINGDLYNNGKTSEMKVGIGADLKVQATGSGSFQVVGKLTQNGTEKVLKIVSLGDYSTATTITTTDIYAGDVSGMYSITVRNVTGFTKIFATITC